MVCGEWSYIKGIRKLGFWEDEMVCGCECVFVAYLENSPK